MTAVPNVDVMKGKGLKLPEELRNRVGLLDEGAMHIARERQNSLTKPPGSLGRLEELSIRLAGITGFSRPRFHRKAVLVFAGDHGVAAEGVSAYPQAVTAQMVLNFLHGGAAINILARQAGARVVVADLGVAADLPEHPQLLSRKVDYGTRNLAVGPAMSREQALEAIRTGAEIVRGEAEKGVDLLATGEMGIGNTTAASAIVAAITGRPVVDVTGRGTGVDEAGWQRKVEVIERALGINRPNPEDPLGVLAKVGGYEIAGLVGVVLEAAARRLPVVVDGFISGAAALIAAEICPPVTRYLIASHNSVERGHRVLLERMELVPLLNLDLRLGEGTGAAIAMHLIDDAVALLDEMATFDEAGVSGREEVGSVEASGQA